MSSAAAITTLPLTVDKSTGLDLAAVPHALPSGAAACARLYRNIHGSPLAAPLSLVRTQLTRVSSWLLRYLLSLYVLGRPCPLIITVADDHPSYSDMRTILDRSLPCRLQLRSQSKGRVCPASERPCPTVLPTPVYKPSSAHMPPRFLQQRASTRVALLAATATRRRSLPLSGRSSSRQATGT